MQYDNAIFNWFSNKITKNQEEYLLLEGEKIDDLRYGENPHQVLVFLVSIIIKKGF